MGSAGAPGFRGAGWVESSGARRALLEVIRDSGVSPRVLAAVERVPREEFVPASLRAAAYADCALPIGHDQTISQPSLVALMTDALRVGPTDRVLEIGTGSGYQAAILANLARRVYSVEVVEPLAVQAAELLTRLGYTNVDVLVGDGYEGWSEHAPYDAICVTASAPSLPPALVAQLAPGGRLVIPVGHELRLITKDEEGRATETVLTAVRFVPLVHGGAGRGEPS